MCTHFSIYSCCYIHHFLFISHPKAHSCYTCALPAVQQHTGACSLLTILQQISPWRQTWPTHSQFLPFCFGQDQVWSKAPDSAWVFSSLALFEVIVTVLGKVIPCIVIIRFQLWCWRQKDWVHLPDTDQRKFPGSIPLITQTLIHFSAIWQTSSVTALYSFSFRSLSSQPVLGSPLKIL